MRTREVIGATVPLSNDECDMLNFIYRKRQRFFVTVYLFLIGTAFVSGLKIDGNTNRWMEGNKEGYHYQSRDTGLSRMQMMCVTVSLLEGFVITTAIFVYYKRVRPLRKDVKNGFKETIYYLVTQKQDFRQTNQFFIGTDHPDYLFHEVDYDTWCSIQVGDNFAIFRAPLSKYVFNNKGKYTVI